MIKQTDCLIIYRLITGLRQPQIPDYLYFLVRAFGLLIALGILSEFQQI